MATTLAQIVSSGCRVVYASDEFPRIAISWNGSATFNVWRVLSGPSGDRFYESDAFTVYGIAGFGDAVMAAQRHAEEMTGAEA